VLEASMRLATVDCGERHAANCKIAAVRIRLLLFHDQHTGGTPWLA
jgi:hypothetical protein